MHRPKLFGCVTIALLFSLSSGYAASKAQAPLAAFEALSPEALKTLQVELSYFGPQDEPIATLLFTPHETLHPNDAEYVHTLEASMEEIQSILRAVRHVVDFQVKTKDPQALPFLSVTLHHGGPKGENAFETILNHRQSKEFFIYLRGAVDHNEEAQRTLQWWGCALDLLPKEIPAKDVTQKIRLVTSGVMWDETTQRFECTATLENASTEFFQEPISLVVESRNNWDLAYYHGTTCITTPVGRRYLHVKTPGGGLWSGAKVSVRLEFEGPGDELIDFTTKVLAGSGER